MTIDPILHLALRGVLVLLFAAALLHKLQSRRAFLGTMSHYLVVLRLGTRTANAAYPAVVAGEVTITAALCGAVSAPWPAIAAGAAFALYGALIAFNVYRGNNLEDCGCSFGASRQPVSYRLVWRNVVLTAVAAMLALPVGVRTIGVIDLVATAGLILLAALLFQIFQQLLVNAGTLPR
jgi:hypothetical protein